MADPLPRAPSGRRSRHRRGSLERPVSARIYRASLVLVVLPLLVLAFTIGRPEPLPRPALPPSFDAVTATRLAEEFAGLFPDRSPGNPDRLTAVAWLRERLEAYGLEVREQRFTASIPDVGEVKLVNIIARPLAAGPRRSPRTIAVIADWDNLGQSPGLDRNASGTGALIELARDFSTITAAHTIVFIATDGGSYGNLGAAALAQDPAFREATLAAVDLDSLGSTGRIRLMLAGDDGRSPSGVLAATADVSVLRQTGVRATHASGLGQLLDLAFPFSLYAQAPLLGDGVSALAITTAGERPPAPTDDPQALDPARLQAVGRSTQGLVASLDTALEAASGTESFIYRDGRLLRGFAIAFLLLVLLVPPILATVDLAVRLRRRGVALAPAFRSYRSRLCVWLFGGGVAALFTAVGLFPNEGGRPLSPYVPAAQQWPSAAIAALAVVAGLGWFAARIRLVPRRPAERGDELAGHVVAMLALSAVAIGVALVNPYTLLFVLPSLHFWLWAPHVRDRRAWLRLLLYATGFAGPVGLVVAFAVRLELGLDAPWYVATLFSVGYAPWTLFLLLLAWGAVAGQVGAVLFGRYAPYPSGDERPERGLVRESVRRAVLLGRRGRRRAREEWNDGPGGVGPTTPVS